MEKLTIFAKPGQTKFTVPTDTKVTIVLCSEIITAAWSMGGAYAGQKAPFQITTLYVGQGAKIVVSGKSEKGVSLGKITGKVLYNEFRDAFELPSSLERGDRIQFTVELPDNELWAQSDSISVFPMTGVHNLQWSAEEALDGDELNLTADVSQVEEGTQAVVTIYRYDPQDGHVRVTAIPTHVQDAKLDVLWVCRYGKSLEEPPMKEELDKRGETDEPPKVFFTVRVGSTEYGKDEQLSGFCALVSNRTTYYSV